MSEGKAAATAIRCVRLSKRFGDIEALKPLDLEIPAGMVFGFVGRNGAGKTTTVRLLTGLARPTTGSAWINGIETTNGNSQAREQFGYLPEAPAFYDWMTPQEFLDYVARLFSISNDYISPRIDQLLELVELQEAARRRIGGFSAGMRQRLGIAQALIHEPPVLLLDEPTSSLDPAGRYEVLNLIDRLRGKVTVFLSSHILQDVERICDLIGMIHRGELLMVAGRDEILEKYPVNTVQLILEPLSLPLPEGFLSDLRDQPWATSVSVEGNIIRFMVSDVARGKKELLPLVVRHNLLLERYEWVRPSLEEIFLQMSSP